MGTPSLDIPFLDRPQIEERAEEALRGAGLTPVPVDPFALAASLQIPVELIDFDDDAIAGRLSRGDGGPRIDVRKDDPPTRQKFTVAHEIGHYLLHPIEDWSDTESTMYRLDHTSGLEDSPLKRAEYQANVFAGALLMPESLLREKWNLLQSPHYLVPIFQVSKAALMRRLVELELVVQSVPGFYYADLAPALVESAKSSQTQLTDDLGAIPKFPPLAVDERGRIIPLSEEERSARLEAGRRAIDAIGRLGGTGDTPGAADLVLRGIDEGRPHRPLFEGLFDS